MAVGCAGAHLRVYPPLLAESTVAMPWYLVGIWSISGRYLVGSWSVDGRCVVDIWLVCGWYLVGIWSVSGRYLVGSWSVYGRQLAGR